MSRLKRPRQIMPEFIRAALMHNDAMHLYNDRPPYQKNDYIGWINRAKKDETKQKRLSQMIEELKAGNLYMKMPYHPKKK